MSSIDHVLVFQGKDEQWYYETIAANNERLAVSEGYSRKFDALRAAGDAYPELPVRTEDPR